MLLTNVVTLWCRLICIEKNLSLLPDLTAVHVVRVIEQCCFNSTPDPFNGQRANFISKPPKVRDHPFVLEGKGCPHFPMVERSQYIRIKNPLHKYFDEMSMVRG